jgi:hypothetical protein
MTTAPFENTGGKLALKAVAAVTPLLGPPMP